MTSKPLAFTPPQAAFVVRDAAYAVGRRWRTAAAVFAGAVALVLVGIMLSPRAYVSEAKLFVRVGRESVGLDPTATTGQTIAVQESRESEINGVVDVLQSRVILQEVVDRLGPRVILGKEPLREEEAAGDAKPQAERATRTVKETAPGMLTSWGLSDPIGEREMAVMRLAKSVGVAAGKKSSVVSVTCEAASPELARRIVDEVIAVFREKHSEVNRTAGSYDFFVRQTAELKSQYETAAAELTTARNELGVASVEGRRTTLQTQISNLEADLLDARKTFAVTTASADATERAMAKLSETVLSQSVSGSPNSAADQTRRHLAELRLQEQKLQTKYAPTHWLVASAREQAEKAERLLADMEPTSLQKTSVPNPARQQMEIKLLTERAQAESLDARRTAVAEQLTELRSELERLNAHEGRLSVLEQKRDVLAASYKTNAEKLEQARLDLELGRDRISNVNVYQPASYVARPAKPNKRLILLAGLVFALAAGVASALAREYGPAAVAVLRGPAGSEQASSGSPTVHDRHVVLSSEV